MTSRMASCATEWKPERVTSSASWKSPRYAPDQWSKAPESSTLVEHRFELFEMLQQLLISAKPSTASIEF